MPATDRRHEVLDALGRAIVGGEIAPGASLTLEDVQSRHGVSRTLARDCVRTLESLGVVESRRRVGIVVRPRETSSALAPQVVRWQLDVDPHGPKLGALTELRAAIEPVAAAAAARRATEACGGAAPPFRGRMLAVTPQRCAVLWSGSVLSPSGRPSWCAADS